MFIRFLLSGISIIYVVCFFITLYVVCNFFIYYKKLQTRLKNKFPKRKLKQLHPVWLSKVLFTAFLKQFKLEFIVTGNLFKNISITHSVDSVSISVLFQPNPYSIKTIFFFPWGLLTGIINKRNKNDIINVILSCLAIIYLIIYILIFIVPIIPLIVNKTQFKNIGFVNFIILHLLPSFILLLIGFGLSHYMPILTIFLMVIFIVLILSNVFAQLCFNTFDSITIMDKNSFILSEYMNLLFGFIIGFASIYYSLFQINSNYFIYHSHSVNPFDFIYFSVLIFATEGFSNILPNSMPVKIFVMAEVLSSIFVLVFLASVYINKKIKEYNESVVKIESVKDLNSILKFNSVPPEKVESLDDFIDKVNKECE